MVMGFDLRAVEFAAVLRTWVSRYQAFCREQQRGGFC